MAVAAVACTSRMQQLRQRQSLDQGAKFARRRPELRSRNAASYSLFTTTLMYEKEEEEVEADKVPRLDHPPDSGPPGEICSIGKFRRVFESPKVTVIFSVLFTIESVPCGCSARFSWCANGGAKSFFFIKWFLLIGPKESHKKNLFFNLCSYTGKRLFASSS